MAEAVKGSEATPVAAAPKMEPVPVAKPRFFPPRTPIGSALRKALRKLPILREPEVQRVGALVGVVSPTCARCASFDLAAGQHVFQQQGDFRMAAAFLTPAQMEKTRGRPWSEQEGFDERGQPVDAGGGPSWSEMGACRRLGKLVFARQTCKEWS